MNDTKSNMGLLFHIGSELAKVVKKQEVKALIQESTYMTDIDLYSKVIELCLMYKVNCQALINLDKNNCRHELNAFLTSCINTINRPIIEE
jgi:hypothetical protein